MTKDIEMTSVSIIFERVHFGELQFRVETLDYKAIAKHQTIYQINRNQEWLVFSRVFPLKDDLKDYKNPDVEDHLFTVLHKLSEFNDLCKTLRKEAEETNDSARREQISGTLGLLRKASEIKKNLGYVADICMMLKTGHTLQEIHEMAR